jgi:hypothetical protein
MKRLIIAISLVTVILPVLAQVRVEVHGQICTFNMEDLKKLQESMFEGSAVPVRTVESFPAFVGVKVALLYPVEFMSREIEVGGVLAFTSTGGRVQYKDFSGDLTGDQRTQVFTLGAQGRGPLVSTEKIKFGMSLIVGFEATKLTLKNSIRIGNDYSESKDKFNATGFVTIPALYLKYVFHDSFYLVADAGYHLTLYQDTYRWSEDEDAELVLGESEETVKPGWDGLRAGIGIGYTF